MENFESKPIDVSVISLMHSIRNKYLKNSQENTQTCLLLEEKIIYTTIACSNDLQIKEGSLQSSFPSIDQLIISFVQKVNKITMENYEQDNQSQSKMHEKFINKTIALLMLPETEKYVKDTAIFQKLKILSFNNLSCIYKKKKKYGVALRAITYAIELEQKILKNEGNPEKYDVIPTYLNKAAIYSEMKKHNDSLQTILKAKAHIEQIQRELSTQIEKTSEQSQKKRLLQKRYYGMYMKMIIFYNMAAEKEHLRLTSQALQFYKQSKQIAIIIDNQLMINKLTHIIDGILQNHR